MIYKIGKTSIVLSDIASVEDCRNPKCCEEWIIYYKQGGHISFSAQEEGMANAIGNCSSKKLAEHMETIIKQL